MASHLAARDDIYCTGYYYCYSLTSLIIKWVIVGAIIAFIFLYCIGGYIHAKRRMKKGLPPLRYHRWLVPRRQRIAFHASHPELPNPYALQAQRTWYTPGYGMHAMPPHSGAGGYYAGPPPPMYGTPEYLPAYQPPQGQGPQQGGVANVNTAKTNPDQVFVREEGAGGSFQGQGQGQGQGQR